MPQLNYVNHCWSSAQNELFHYTSLCESAFKCLHCCPNNFSLTCFSREYKFYFHHNYFTVYVHYMTECEPCYKIFKSLEKTESLYTHHSYVGKCFDCKCFQNILLTKPDIIIRNRTNQRTASPTTEE